MLVRNSFHLTYCANVHPGETWSEAFTNLRNHYPKVKAAVCPDEKFGVGLYLSDKASREILDNGRLQEFKSWLEREGLYVFTMNGFPFGGFHGNVVKDNVYKPDWTQRERVDYTKRLFSILSELLPDGADGGISTSPVSYKYWFNATAQREGTFDSACAHLVEVAVFLDELSAETGRQFHLDIEPEPDCFLENSEESIDFFNRLTSSGNDAIIRRRINLCYDICHFSVEYEDPETALRKLTSAGIRIGKIQISSALKARENEKMRSELRQFSEPRYLHQTVKRAASNELKRFRDLPEAMKDAGADSEWRTHFHVPLFLDSYGSLRSTQDDVLKTLDYLKKNPVTHHLEVETYTWDVLPSALKQDLTCSIIRELEWVKKHIAA